MSMTIGNNVRTSGYPNSASSTGEHKSVREYSNYLMGKYSCLTPGKNTAVSVTSGLLRKAMNDEEAGQWLERELSKAPDYIKEAQQSASARGSKLIFCAIEFGEEYSTMYTCTVSDTPDTDKDIDKWIERVKENRGKQTAAVPGMDEHTLRGTDLKSLVDSFVEKMSGLQSATGSAAGFDMRA